MTGKPLTSRDQARIENSPPLQGRGRGWGVSAGKLDQLQERSRHMRNEATGPEKRLWAHLSRSQLGGYKFRRQSVIGPFIADFMCPAKGLIVEVDGHTHTDPATDARRDAKLSDMGFRVFRVTNEDVMRNLEGVCETLLALLAEIPSCFERPHPNPSPKGEGLKEGISLDGSLG